MSEILVQKLLSDIPVRVSENKEPRFKSQNYNLYIKCFRSYKKLKIRKIRLISYLTDEEIKRRRRDAIQKDSQLENRIKDTQKDIAKIKKRKRGNQ